jgi:hypothetical protein
MAITMIASTMAAQPGEPNSVMLYGLGAQQVGVLARQLRGQVVELVAGQRHLEGGENRAGVLASLLRGAAICFGFRDPSVELIKIESLAWTLGGHRVGERRRKLACEIRGLATR